MLDAIVMGLIGAAALLVIVASVAVVGFGALLMTYGSKRSEEHTSELQSH